MQTTRALDDDRVMNLVELALSRPRDERQVYLQSVCAGDTELFGAVWNYVQAEERMNGFLLDPLCQAPPPERPFEPGDLVEARFHVIREVARGGMGVVYEVADEKLDRRVAIKCAQAGFKMRLPPEVRNGRSISHPNVCRIFEMHTASTAQGEVDFITMEFLDGETLSERLRAGRLPDVEAREIARQLCAGLAEAHRNQIIHGDLKSGNVILTKTANGAMRAVITDFGLARGLDASLRNAQSGDAGGTPAYMAPELWKGEKASIASDIYALGVILFELASGKSPHPKEDSWPRMSWERRLAWKPPAVHPKWDRVLTRCLDPDPARRFHDADQIAVALGPSRSRRWFLLAAAAVVLATATGVVTYERTRSPKKSAQVAMSPFQASQENASLAEGLFRDTTAQLSRLKGSADTRFKFLADKTPGATEVLQGTLNNESGKVILDAHLTDPRSGIDTREWKAEYTPSETRYIPTALTGFVTETLHLPPAQAPAVNQAARQDYLAGVKDTRRNSTIDVALPLLERAVQKDPDSSLTRAGLAEAQWIKYFVTKDAVWLSRTAESVRLAEIRNPDVAAVHRIAGVLKENDGAYEQAVAEYQRAIEIEPGNSDAYRRLGEAYKTNGQMDLALTAFRRAVELEPTFFKTYQALGAFYMDRANYTDAASQFQKVVALAPDEPDAHYALGSAYMELGRFPEAVSEFRSALAHAESPKILDNLGIALMYQEEDNEAIPYLLRSLKLSPGRSSMVWVNLETAYRQTNRSAKSRLANHRGLELAEKEVTQDPRSGQVHSRLAYFCARMKDTGRAESEAAQALHLSPADAETRWTVATTYEALHQRSDTLRVLNASPDGVLADLSRWPDVAELRKDPRFIQLLADRKIKTGRNQEDDQHKR
jgi:eukaryotic-like serine/threonine-protein kinase